MASKIKSNAGLSDARKRLKRGTDAPAASSPHTSQLPDHEKDIKRKRDGGAFDKKSTAHENPDPVNTSVTMDRPLAPGEKRMLSKTSATVVVVQASALIEPDSSLSNPLMKEELTLEQKLRMELNKSIANAIRNVKRCEDRVSESRALGLPFPDFKSILVEQRWSEVLSDEFGKAYMNKLYQFVKVEAGSGSPIYPPPAKVFNAFNTCPFEKVKVVILGQDPYHGPGQAMGLCFSVEKGVKFPSSLINIFKEIQDDVGCSIPSHGNLEKWSYQGVLLLNAALTVQGGKANSHSKKGWEVFTDAAIKAIATQRSGIVFLLWGNSAQDKVRLINQNVHHILKAAHPSGLSAHRGFFKCRHFSQTNKILEKQGLLPIDWQI